MTRLFDALVDDAGLFPPERLPMPAAVARHRADEATAQPLLTHRFLCPANRLAELLGELDPQDRFRLGVIAELEPAALRSALEQVAGEPRVTLAVVEGPMGSMRDPAALAEVLAEVLADVPASVPCHVEVSLFGAWEEALASLAAAGRAAKVRCGGVRAELFPSAERLGAFVHAAARQEVPFKATAGLHRALPYRDERTGFDHHGFLNLLLAAGRATDGGTAADVVDMLRVTDASALVKEARDIAPDLAAATRRLFVAYGSCSTREPIDDLHALGLLSGTEVSA